MATSKTLKSMAITLAFAAAAQYLGGVLGASGLQNAAGHAVNQTPEFHIGRPPLADDRTPVDFESRPRFLSYDNKGTMRLTYKDGSTRSCAYDGRIYHLAGVPVYTRKTVSCQP